MVVLRWLVVGAVVTALVGISSWQHRASHAWGRGPVDTVREAGWRLLAGGPGESPYVPWNDYCVVAPGSPQRLPAVCSCEVVIRCRGDSPIGIGTVASPAGYLWYAGHEGGYSYFGVGTGVRTPYAVRIASRRGLVSRGVISARMTARQAVPGAEQTEGPVAPRVPSVTFTITCGGDAELGEGYSEAQWRPVRAMTWAGPGSLREMHFSGRFDGRSWGRLGKYAVAFENIRFDGRPADVSALAPTPLPGTKTVWVEGSADGTIGLWQGHGGRHLGPRQIPSALLYDGTAVGVEQAARRRDPVTESRKLAGRGPVRSSERVTCHRGMTPGPRGRATLWTARTS